ncbi:recombinase family protein [Pseudomonas aeruginosa]|uniref:recombinase family protein n=1 Tax=Pseudomonas aeruginosa TaxID=287 RepID=UPI000F51B912|nr:recombinase family protein [Pseudomonas aeruginosa]RPX43526.1 recombinase family protein [Pseudomonas aeruginosa]WCV85086.1 recombinase family protein [Pseudomonas aeruginosa]
MPAAYAYIRYSRAVQQTGDSENRQYTALELFEHTTGIAIAEVVYDRGKSAFRGDNAKTGKFKEILDRIEQGSIHKGDFLVVESIDRITRQRVLDGVELLQGILKKGINIYTTTDQKTYSYNDPSRDFENLLMISLIAKRANEESETKSKRLLSSWNKRREKAQSGEIIIKKGNSIPYGLSVVDGQFVINEEEQKEIQTLFEYLLTYGLNTAIKKINLISKRTWNNGTVNKIITNKTVIGCLATHRVEYENGKSRKISTGYIENYYPKLISTALFYQALDKMKERKSKNYNGRRTEQDFNIFKNQIFCLSCGDKIYYDHRGSRYKGKIYPHFKCNTKRINPSKCNTDNIRFEYVFGLLLKSLEKLKKTTDVWKLLQIDEGEAGKNNLLNAQFGGLLRRSPSVDTNTLIKEKAAELGQFRTTYENLSISIRSFGGKIPLPVMQELASTEAKIEELTLEVAALEARNHTETIEIEDYQSLIDLFMTEEGRAKINTFFKENNIVFYAEHHKQSTLSQLRISRSTDGAEEELIHTSAFLPKKQILKAWNLNDLQEMFDLTV